MLQFCRNNLEIGQNCKTLLLVLVQILCYLLLVVINGTFIVNEIYFNKKYIF